MPDIDASACWYVVQTQPNAENKAVANLVRQGFPVYLPRYRKHRRHARKTEIVAAPLFPRYLFISIDKMSQRWRSIQSTYGVSHLVCNGDQPAMVPRGIVEGIRAREGEGGLIDIETHPRFSRGDKVCISDGAFGDCLGLFESTTDSGRVSILLELLGRKVRVLLSAEDVVAA